MKLMGNKGEWSEFYAFVKLLSMGKLYAADENVKRIDNIYFPIIKIIRCEESGEEIDYVISEADGSVNINCDEVIVKTLSNAALSRMAAYLYSGITMGNNRAFEIEDADKIMTELECKRISAPSTDKTDITMQLHDINTGYNPICGFSIKSELGSAPTLLNASGATNFVFEVIGLTDEQAEQINAINTDTKIKDRIAKIFEYGSIEFRRAKNSNFSENLMLIDTYMEEMIGALLLDYYCGNAKDCKTLVERLEDKNPLGYPRKGIYSYKFKKFLCSVALGMMPSVPWNGQDEANGGYVIVKHDGDVVAYYIYNRDAFENYLLNNTRLERGSTTKHGFANIYKEPDGKMYINLNLQVRFS